MFHARRVVEQVVEGIYDLENLPAPYRDDLAARLADDAFQRAVGIRPVETAHAIRKVGNVALHRTQPISEQVALKVLAQLHLFCRWAAGRYTTDQAWRRPDPFDVTLVRPREAAWSGSESPTATTTPSTGARTGRPKPGNRPRRPDGCPTSPGLTAHGVGLATERRAFTAAPATHRGGFSRSSARALSEFLCETSPTRLKSAGSGVRGSLSYSAWMPS